ncbi:hypothetical protein POM88_053292 [Heracleum sosnowskyi]|uniref:UDP-glycosyltransferase n=1 Tax=Heracleum sosnowskyi TaxID=360622 RepID=A0AAD8LXS7_9APIA|nr:hypothetical protein POM88_053292 [Heracleum sosnowskyi]
MVSWTPQVKVLRHPSIACFLSHCGWNSTSEGVSNGVPFLCWPYFADQFLNQTYICDVWKVGLRCDKDETGIVSKGTAHGHVVPGQDAPQQYTEERLSLPLVLLPYTI